MQKAILILGLFATSCLGTNKINLEDIERDNLRAESGSSAPFTKTDSGNHNYQYAQQHPDHYEGGLGSYTTVASNHDGYRVQQANTDSYTQDGSENDIPYEKDTRDNGAYVNSQSKNVYPDYTEEIPDMPNSFLQTTYQHQQVYQVPQISVGNQYQKNQQKAATVKYSTAPYKGTIYIPMSQFLAYYPHLSLGHGSTLKSEALLHHLATQSAQRIPVPVYKPGLNQVTFTNTPSKMSYETSYAGNQSKKSQQTDVIFPSKTDHLRPQMGYVQELIYASTSSPYEPVAPSHLTTYTSVPVYIQGQAIPHAYKQMREYSHYDEAKKLQYTVPLNKPVYRTQDEQNVEQHYQKTSNSPNPAFTSKSYAGGNLNLLNHIHTSGGSDEHYRQKHLEQISLPKSLLDTYVPSHIIAAQDTDRYRERPLQLEGGFLPSKINFVNLYKKRKSE